MYIFPAIDLYEGRAVRLLKGDYNQMTVYSDTPLAVARDFVREGARHIHLVDLEGARDGTTPNLSTVTAIAKETPLFTEIGGGIRSMQTLDAYLSAGVDRAILGTAAVNDPAFLKEALRTYGDRIAVGIDVRDGFVATHGWLTVTEHTLTEFSRRMADAGVRTLICTDISRDGAMRGANREMYRELQRTTGVRIVASGGVSSMDDVRALADMKLYGAIIGRAYYTGDIRLSEAVYVAEGGVL